MFGKIINGTMYRAPSVIVHDGKTYINPSDAILQAEGYVRLTFSPCPPPDEGFRYVEQWTDDGVQHWVPVENDDEQSQMQEQINDLMDALNILTDMFLEGMSNGN